MAKSRVQKESLLEKYNETLSSNKGFIAVDVRGVETTAITELKKKLKAIGSNVLVVKNNIFQIALKENNMPEQAVNFAEQTAVIPYSDDPTAPAKLIQEVQKETEALPARYGVVDGRYFDSEKIMQLAEIPSREVLLSKLLGSMTSPLGGFMSVANGNTKGFVRVLQQLSEKSEG